MRSSVTYSELSTVIENEMNKIIRFVVYIKQDSAECILFEIIKSTMNLSLQENETFI